MPARDSPLRLRRILKTHPCVEGTPTVTLCTDLDHEPRARHRPSSMTIECSLSFFVKLLERWLTVSKDLSIARRRSPSASQKLTRKDSIPCRNAIALTHVWHIISSSVRVICTLRRDTHRRRPRS